jgi:hypothetical protein
VTSDLGRKPVDFSPCENSTHSCSWFCNGRCRCGGWLCSGGLALVVLCNEVGKRLEGRTTADEEAELQSV